MAINFTDFSRAPLLESPFKNALENVLKGYKISQEPAKMAEEQKKRQLTNQLKEFEVENKPTEIELNNKEKTLANSMKEKALETYNERWELDKKFKQAQIDKAMRAGTQAGLKPNKDVANAEFIYQKKKEGADPEEIAILERAFNAGLAHTQALTENTKDIAEGRSFDKQPINDKKQSVAYMRGMGVNSIEAVDYLRQKGHTPETYAKEHNIDFNTVQPSYAPGEQNIKDAQRALAYRDEIDNFEKHITEGLGPFQNKIKGYSLKQIADAAEGKNTDQQAKALAARALSPELIALRLKIMGGNIGIEALKELSNKSLNDLNIIESLVDEKTFKKAQEYMQEWIKEASDIRIKSLMGHSMLKTKLEKNAEAEKKSGEEPQILGTQNGVTTIRNGNKTLRIPEKLVDKYMMEHMPTQFGGQYGQ